MRGVVRIEVQETAGELGALLLESKYIKELKPLRNIAARRRLRIIVATKKVNKHGFAEVVLNPIDYWSVDTSTPVLGLFKHLKQAKEYLTRAAREYRLCPKLLGLERQTKYCFSYHLGYCDGACMGEGDPDGYNARLEKAFDDRRIKAWPFRGPIVFEETSPLTGARESFVIDNWCLLSSFRSNKNGATLQAQEQHRFDYDSYKILYGFLTDTSNRKKIRVPVGEELRSLKMRLTSAQKGDKTQPRKTHSGSTVHELPDRQC